MNFKGILHSIMFLLVSTSIFAQNDSDVLITVGGQDVTVDEFRYIYEKNNGEKADYSQSSLKEYLDLYTKFKLKVAEAKAIGLAEDKELQKELDGYRKQLADSYIMDKEVINSLTKELYERKQEDIKLKHIHISVSKRANAKEKAAKRKKAEEVLAMLKKGEDFAKIARTYSQDKASAKGGGEFGWLTAKLPSGFYDFENALYTLKPNELSDVIETPLGFHIIMVTDRRPARGKIRVAHILKRKNKKNPGAAKEAIDRLYDKITNTPSTFDGLVKQSDDDKTRLRGGELPVFGIKIYDEKFENAAFGLMKDGDVSAPVETKAGYHIIKRLEKPALEPYDEYAAKMQAAIKKDERYEKQKERVVEDIKKKAHYKVDETALKNYISTLDESLYTYKWKPGAVKDAVLFSFNGDEKYMVSDFAKYLKSITRFRLRYDNNDVVEEVATKFYNDFVKEKTLEYEEQELLKRHKEYRSLMREYEEGILLFEISKREVWDKASQDSVGLNNYYNQYSNNYKWKDRAEVAYISAKVKDEKMARDIYKNAGKKSIEDLLKKFNKDGQEIIQVETKMIEKGSKGDKDFKWENGHVTDMTLDKSLNQKFAKVISVQKPTVKTLDEARGYVIADYQEVLEKAWIEKLMKKYEIEFNDKVFNKLKK